jgi:hypothetical protein
MVLKANAANILDNNHVHSNIEREQLSDINSRRSSDVEIIKVTVEDLKPKSPLQQPLLIQTAN